MGQVTGWIEAQPQDLQAVLNSRPVYYSNFRLSVGPKGPGVTLTPMSSNSSISGEVVKQQRTKDPSCKICYHKIVNGEGDANPDELFGHPGNVG